MWSATNGIAYLIVDSHVRPCCFWCLFVIICYHSIKYYTVVPSFVARSLFSALRSCGMNGSSFEKERLDYRRTYLGPLTMVCCPCAFVLSGDGYLVGLFKAWRVIVHEQWFHYRSCHAFKFVERCSGELATSYRAQFGPEDLACQWSTYINASKKFLIFFEWVKDSLNVWTRNFVVLWSCSRMTKIIVSFLWVIMRMLH